MRRREFITLLGGAAAWPLTARAQQAAMPIVAWVHGGFPDANALHLAAFQKGLSETGYIEDHNAVERYWLHNQYEQERRFASQRK